MGRDDGAPDPRRAAVRCGDAWGGGGVADTAAGGVVVFRLPRDKQVGRYAGAAAGRRSPAEIEAAMQEFRAGQKPASVMDHIAKGFSADELAVIAAWYAAQKD